MELKWLEDFIALNDNQSFSKAAIARHVTQPAFSRRIRALENWLGVSLIDRSSYPTGFTAAGEEFLKFARQAIVDTYSLRESLRGDMNATGRITIRSQHSLTVSFLPKWLQTLEPLVSDKLIQVHANDLHDAVDSFIAGSGNFLLCYASENTINSLTREDIECLQIGTDSLVPVTGVDGQGNPLHQLENNAPLKTLNYPTTSFFGKLIQTECMPRLGSDIQLDQVYENALSEALKASVLSGYGIAWLPKTLITNELATHQLMLLAPPLMTVSLKIQLFRFAQHQNPESNTFWDYLNSRAALTSNPSYK